MKRNKREEEHRLAFEIHDEEETAFSNLMQEFARERGEELMQLNEQLKNDPAYEVPEELRRRNLEIIRGK